MSILRDNSYSIGTYQRDYNNGKIEDKDELILLKDVKDALKYVPESATSKLIAEHFGFNINKELHLKALYDKNMPFYKKYIHTTALYTLMRNKVDRVIQNNLEIKDGDILLENIDILPFKDLALITSIYNRCLVNLTNVDNTLEMQVLPPTNYFLDKDKCVIWAYQGTDYKRSAIYDLVVTYTNEEGRIVEEISKAVITNNRLEIIAVEDRYVDVFKYFEVHSNKEKSDLEEIEVEILSQDMVESFKQHEIRGTAFSLHVDEKYTNNGIVRKGIYSIYTASLSENKPLFEPYQPNLRALEYDEIHDSYNKRIASNLGVSQRVLGLNINANELATGMLLDEEQSINTINSIKQNIEVQFNKGLANIDIPYRLSLGTYFPQSLSIRSNIVRSIETFTDVKTRLLLLFPSLNEEQLLDKVVRFKQENMIPMTAEEEEYGINNRIIAGI